MIVDDHEIVRHGLADLVDRTDELQVCAEAGSVAEAVRRSRAVQPDIALVDLRLPDGTGIDVIKALREHCPETRCVVLTSFDDPDARTASRDAGAIGFMLKSVSGREIVDGLLKIVAGEELVDVVPSTSTAPSPAAKLTNSELRIVELVGQGLSNREVAEQLGLAEKTIKNHLTSILAKMGLKRRTQIVAWLASRRGQSWDH
ncbi:response regulator transcription factor [Micrococcales bacterium 31B]|nr:response regulator transcription factor [Micrococcales bacterium 31B]